jgi:hypothetical protein
VWDTSQAVEEVTAKYRECYPNGEELPAVPKLIGGCPVDIMLGAKYTRWFPQVKFMADCGLSIHQSQLMAPNNETGVLIGPHRSWKEMQSNHMVMRVYSAVPINRPEHEPEDPRVEEVVDVHGDAFDAQGLKDEDKINVNCEGEHCPKHSEDDCRLPPTWEVGTNVYATACVKERWVKFREEEDMGEGVEYRCPACRNCWSCKEGDRLEAVSLKEEREQFLVQKSVRYDREERKLVARLPFLVDPELHLKPNMGIARKVFSTQLKKAEKDETVRAGIVKSHKKLADKGFVVKVADLDPATKEHVEKLTGYVIPWRTVVKESSISTPVRMVFDASSRTPGGESLNAI